MSLSSSTESAEISGSSKSRSDREITISFFFHLISLYLRHRGMDSTACSCSREAARKIGLSLQGAQTAFVLCSRIPPDHNPPYPPLVSALRLVCCLRIQIWLSLSTCCACSHRVFTLGAPCMGLLGPCRLKSFLRQSIYYHTVICIHERSRELTHYSEISDVTQTALPLSQTPLTRLG